MIERIAAGRTDLVFVWCADGHAATARDGNGTSLLHWCAYYGDVSAIRFLMSNGATLADLGPDLGLGGAAFHGHWRLCQFLLEQGADVRRADPLAGETALHAAVCRDDPAHDRVVQVLLDHGADVHATTRIGMETGCFMRDCRTRGETPLHRAAACASGITIKRLLQAGADPAARDANGDSPLGWASWRQRSTDVLQLLCFGPHRIHPEHRSMDEHLLGDPQSSSHSDPSR